MLQLYVAYATGKARLANGIKSFFSNQSGVTAIEYGLIASLVGVAIVVITRALGVQLVATFQNVITALAG